MGMQFFAGNLKFDVNDKPNKNGTSVRYNFDTFPKAFLSIFIILTGENWNNFMYDAMRATSNLAWVYYIIVMVMGNIIIVQLLLAIIITNFDESRKFTQKRNIIDEIELNIELGKTVGESIAIVLGEDFNLEQDEEKLKNVSVRLSKKKRKANQYHKIQIDSGKGLVWFLFNLSHSYTISFKQILMTCQV